MINKYLIFLSIFFIIGCSGDFSKNTFYNFKKLKEKNIVMQRFDYSCGTGALATLLKYYYNDSVDEIELLNDIQKHLPKNVFENRQKYGFSMLDLQELSERRGYQAIGAKLNYSSLLKLDRPVLVYLESKNYKHFAIYKGFREDRIFLADPNRGNIRMTTDCFFQEWKNRTALILFKDDYKILKSPLHIDFELPLRPEIFAIKKEIFQ